MVWLSINYAATIHIFFVFFCSTSSGLSDNVLADRMVYYKSINQVFAGWDFGLYKEKSVRVKKSLIRLEITVRANCLWCILLDFLCTSVLERQTSLVVEGRRWQRLLVA